MKTIEEEVEETFHQYAFHPVSESLLKEKVKDLVRRRERAVLEKLREKVKDLPFKTAFKSQEFIGAAQMGWDRCVFAVWELLTPPPEGEEVMKKKV